jgi:hypothetical protein
MIKYRLCHIFLTAGKVMVEAGFLQASGFAQIFKAGAPCRAYLATMLEMNEDHTSLGSQTDLIVLKDSTLVFHEAQRHPYAARMKHSEIAVR